MNRARSPNCLKRRSASLLHLLTNLGAWRAVLRRAQLADIRGALLPEQRLSLAADSGLPALGIKAVCPKSAGVPGSVAPHGQRADTNLSRRLWVESGRLQLIRSKPDNFGRHT